MLLIGGDSYLGRSIAESYRVNGISVVSFSLRKIFSDFTYSDFSQIELSNFEFAIIIGTPGHFTSSHQSHLDIEILNSLENSGIKSYGISTIRVLDAENFSKNEYIKENLLFEDTLIQNTSFKILRIPNFIGVTPNRYENQSKLLPWSILEEVLTFGKIQILSSLDSEFEWVCSDDICNAISIIENLGSKHRIFELQTGFCNRLGELLKGIHDFSLLSLDKSFSIHGAQNSMSRKLIYGSNPMGKYNWKSIVGPNTFEREYRLYFQKNWRNNV